jgi:hypothetical protein
LTEILKKRQIFIDNLNITSLYLTYKHQKHYENFCNSIFYNYFLFYFNTLTKNIKNIILIFLKLYIYNTLKKMKKKNL